MVDADGTSGDWAAPGSAPSGAPQRPAAAQTTFTPGPPPPPEPDSSGAPAAAPPVPPPAGYAVPPPAGYAVPPPAGYAVPTSAPGVGYSSAPAGGTPQQGLHTAPLTYRSWQPGILALRPLSFGDFLTVPFRAFRYSRATVVGGPTVMTLLSTAATVISAWLFFTDPLLGISDFNPQFEGIQPMTVVSVIIAVLSWFAADMLATAMVLIGVSRAVLGEKVSFGAAWKQLVPRIPQLILLYLLTGAIFVAAGIVGSLVIIAGFAADSPELTGLGTLVLYAVVIPVIVVVGVYLPAARGAVVMERVNVIAGVRRALAVMKRRFWWTVLILIVCGTAVGVVTNILQTVGVFVGSFGVLLAPESEWAWAVAFGVGYGVALILSNIITYAFLGSVYGLIYIDGRMRREGFDVELARAAEARHTPNQVVVG